MTTLRLIHNGSFDATLGFAPWRLSGTVVGPLHNDPASLAALGDAVRAAPYQAPPRAPVLYVKPRNTLAGSGADVGVPDDAPGLEVGATVGLVIGRAACRVRAADALAHVAGWVLVADLSVPHTSFYRPNVRLKARDRSCLIGAAVAATGSSFVLDAARLRVAIEGQAVHDAALAGMRRPAAQLIQDVSDFMTLHPGDVLLLGVRHGAPVARSGQRFAIEGEGLGRIEGRVVTDAGGVSDAEVSDAEVSA